jgi:hypothetical protein
MNRSKARDQRFWEKWRRSGAVSTVVAARMVSLKDMRPKEAYNEFLYPISRQFPVDEVCGQIVRELEKRNWQVPGIVVDFHDYGTGAQKFRMVSNIRGEEFRLHFGHYRCVKKTSAP